MKRLLIIFLSIFILSTKFAFSDGHAIKKEGFFSKDFKITELSTIKNPENKIVLINNHGQNNLDGTQKDCTTVDQVRNRLSLIDQEVNGKKIMVYNLCAHKIKGDMGKAWWISKKPYVGKSKLDRRVEQNLELVEKLVSLGIPRKQVFVTGHSCGGLTTLMFFARHGDKAGGGIAYAPACFDKLSKKYKVKKKGLEEALARFKKKKPAQFDLRAKYNDEILNQVKTPLLVFTHPKDTFEGLTSDWLDNVEGMNRIVISTDYKINGKKCFKLGKKSTDKFPVNDGHQMDQATCFQEYNPEILNYIKSRI
jgi:hypothetical protein